MTIDFLDVNGSVIAHIISEEIEIKDTQDAIDLMANCLYNGAEKIILNEKNIISDFFDLKTGIAGEVLQKFSTYQCRLAIVGDFNKFNSKSLESFIYESNQRKQINFVSSIEEARDCLA